MNSADEQAAQDYYTLLGTYLRELNKAHKGIRRLVRRNRKLAEHRVSVTGVWHGDQLFWQFQSGKMRHEISDHNLKAWLHNKSGLPSHKLPHDGCIRAVHTSAYIDNELFVPEPPK